MASDAHQHLELRDVGAQLPQDLPRALLVVERDLLADLMPMMPENSCGISKIGCSKSKNHL